MSDAPVKIDQFGARLVTVLTGTQQTLDCTTLARRWIRVWSEDQSFYYFMGPAGLTMNLTASALPLTTAGIPLACAAGEAGQPILVDPKYPILYVRGKSGTAQIQVKTTSDVLTSQ